MIAGIVIRKASSLSADFFMRSSLSMVLVFVVGLVKIAEPLGGDQSLFLIGAHELHDGALLYRDFWDLKQPGIYAFYFIATSFGPYSAVTIHAFELVYLSLFSIALIAALRRSRTFGPIAPFAPLGVVAFYYLAVGSFEAIQVESLVAFPLFLTLASFVAGAREPKPLRSASLFLVGGCASVLVLAFKLIFLPLVVALWLVPIVASASRRRVTFVSLGATLAGTTVGIALPSAAIVAFFALHGTLELALQTWFTLPTEIIKFVPHEPLGALLAGLRWFVHRYVAMLALAIVGVLIAFRRGADAFAGGLLAWIAIGTASILVQVTSWFQYQWLLITAPIGIFAVFGAYGLYQFARQSTRVPLTRVTAAATLVIGAVIFPTSLLARDILALAKYRFALTETTLEAYRDSQSFVYASLRKEALFVQAHGGALYVIGDPTFYVVTHRLQPIALNGSSVRLFLPDQWETLERELSTAKPEYIYRSHGVRLSPKLAKDMIAIYTVAHRGTLGDLFVRRSH